MPRVETMEGVALRIRGLVQGVGFRPHIWRLARDAGLKGEVRNDGEGVVVSAWGPADALECFSRRIREEAPPMARIDSMERGVLSTPPPWDDFRIVSSADGRIATGIVPDAATCPDCLKEIRDPSARRHGYAFTNCTQCGPRLSIVTGIPYDRRRTSMARFPMCPECRAEYEDPTDRRFHAQPIACPRCGPRLWLEGSGVDAARDPIAAAAEALRAGRILAIKGIGGFHLSCDATNGGAVAELRRRKRRGDKPFALMMPNLVTAARFVVVDADARGALTAASAPIVLLPLRTDGEKLPGEIAPDQGTLGIMLPYSPLHHRLIETFGGPLVMTSGNRADEPQCIDNQAARETLSGLADFHLMHDRDIVNRIDDSVLRIAAGRSRMLRRARGFAPGRMVLPAGLASVGRILALGADLKNTLCLAEGGAATLSQHLGDLGNVMARAEAERSLELYRELFGFSPDCIVVDLHPDYASTRFGEALAEATGARLMHVQHHHAHIASCLAENGIDAAADPVLGIALDGAGYGADRTIWGGEFLLCDYRSFRRVGCFTPVALPGGDAAAREPWRNLYAQLRRLGAPRRWSALNGLADKPLEQVDKMISAGINTPLSSSAGRLFDAMAAFLGIVPNLLSFEAEAAQKLEALAVKAPSTVGAYPLALRDGDVLHLDAAPLWRAAIADLAGGVGASVIARRFHNGIADALIRMAVRLREMHGFRCVALSGGVFHNRLLLEYAIDGLEARGLTVFTQAGIPCGDGGIALGQAAIGAADSLSR